MYDTESCCYVTLKQVAASIRQNRIIEVIDTETGNDITLFTLTNILMDMAKQGNHLLPLSLLHVCVQYGQDSLNDIFINHLEKTIQNYIDNRKLIDDSLDNVFTFGEQISENAMDVLKSTNLFPWLDDYLSR